MLVYISRPNDRNMTALITYLTVAVIKLRFRYFPHHSPENSGVTYSAIAVLPPGRSAAEDTPFCAYFPRLAALSPPWPAGRQGGRAGGYFSATNFAAGIPPDRVSHPLSDRRYKHGITGDEYSSAPLFRVMKNIISARLKNRTENSNGFRSYIIVTGKVYLIYNRRNIKE